MTMWPTMVGQYSHVMLMCTLCAILIAVLIYKHSICTWLYFRIVLLASLSELNGQSLRQRCLLYRLVEVMNG